MIQMQSRLTVSSYNMYDERQNEVDGDSIHVLNAVSSGKDVAIAAQIAQTRNTCHANNLKCVNHVRVQHAQLPTNLQKTNTSKQKQQVWRQSIGTVSI